MTASKTYRVFGLTLQSDLVLDVLDEVSAPPDEIDLVVERGAGVIRLGPYHYDPYFLADAEEQYFHWLALGAFRISAPDRVQVELYPGVPDHLASHALLGLVMAMTLERRGILSLHASAVSVASRAAVLLGDKGAGKSTTCGALMARGYRPITDDLVAVDGRGDPDAAPVIWPGYASTKLYPDSIKALGMADVETLRNLTHTVDKQQKRMPLAVVPDPVPLGPLFVLRRSPEVETAHVNRLPPHRALQMVMRYAFMARYGETRLGPQHLVGHLKRSGAVVSHVPVYELMIPEDLGGLDALVETIVAAVEAPDGA